ncbi:MAG: ATP-grasp domain-containing protein [Acidimicrobiia bacterium]
MDRVVIVASCESYRIGDFIAAARSLRVTPVVATDAASPFAAEKARSIVVDLDDPETAAAEIKDSVPHARAVVPVDDQGVRVAAAAAGALGLPTNPAHAVAATRDKLAMRTLLGAAGIRQPRFASVAEGTLGGVADTLGYPIVVKPTSLAASRGVIRLDTPKLAGATEARVRSIAVDAGMEREAPLIAEEYIGGHEMAIEGILIDGTLEVLALLDKPVPLRGPYFEETMFVSPSTQPEAVTKRTVDTVTRAIAAIGLVTGPVHAEVRIDEGGAVFVIEIAARSIGGLCGRSLTFGLLGESLESVVLRSALGRASHTDEQTSPATGVLMLPIPAAGLLTGVEGVDEALTIDGIDSIEITIPDGRTVVPLPEGDRYLGFVFATGPSPSAVRHSLAAASLSIHPVIDGEHVTSEGQSAAGRSSRI